MIVPITIESKVAQVVTCILESDGTIAALSDIVRQVIVLQDADTRRACAEAVYENECMERGWLWQ